MATVDDLVEANRLHAESFTPITTGAEPQRRLAVVACMDARLDPLGILGLDLGEAHIIRNAGGVVTDDVIRSLLLSQRTLGTTDIVLLQHSKCGVGTITDEEIVAGLEADTGSRPSFAIGAFTDPFESVRRSMAQLLETPFVDASWMWGFVYDIDTGRLLPVDPPG